MTYVPGPFLRQIAVRSFRSIETCNIALRPLTVLVGRNGSGKSNLLDALRFVTDSLQTSIDHALKSRGGIGDVRRRSTGHPANFAIKLEFSLPDYRIATYGFEIAARQNGGFAVKFEQLQVRDTAGLSVAQYRREETRIESSDGAGTPAMPPVVGDRLYLVNAAGLPAFRPAYDALLAMGFYNLNPESIKELQSPDAGELLHSDGSNIASVISRLTAHDPQKLQRIKDYLATIVPGVENVERVSLGPRETIQFGQRVEGAQHPWKFFASSMSDGTLRALGTLVAVTQLGRSASQIRLVGIEEPETALHPAAAGSLMDALREASSHTQIILTTHSADLLDQIAVDREGLLVVVSRNGNTKIAPADAASLQAIREHLYLPGELLRLDQLQPDETDLREQEQLELFDTVPVPA